MNFLGLALLDKSPVGVALAVWVHFVYRVACRYEDSFTSAIYAEAAKAAKTKTK
jgi:type IV secretory pathway VirB3-like protein